MWAVLRKTKRSHLEITSDSWCGHSRSRLQMAACTMIDLPSCIVPACYEASQIGSIPVAPTHHTLFGLRQACLEGHPISEKSPFPYLFSTPQSQLITINGVYLVCITRPHVAFTTSFRVQDSHPEQEFGIPINRLITQAIADTHSLTWKSWNPIGRVNRFDLFHPCQTTVEFCRGIWGCECT